MPRQNHAAALSIVNLGCPNDYGVASGVAAGDSDSVGEGDAELLEDDELSSVFFVVVEVFLAAAGEDEAALLLVFLVVAEVDVAAPVFLVVVLAAVPVADFLVVVDECVLAAVVDAAVSFLWAQETQNATATKTAIKDRHRFFIGIRLTRADCRFAPESASN